jgi:uncharacterized protein YxjI
MSTSIFPQFFEANEYFIDQKVNFLKFGTAYRVYNGQGRQVGNIVQKVSGWHKFLRLLLNKGMFPFTLQVRNMDETVQATIKRGWTFFMSKIVIFDQNNTPIGGIKQKFKLFKPSFQIFDSNGTQIAQISGDWKAWNFIIEDTGGQQIGTINKKWTATMKEIFTNADKYMVSIVPEYAEDFKKIAIVASAISIDMVLREGR